MPGLTGASFAWSRLDFAGSRGFFFGNIFGNTRKTQLFTDSGYIQQLSLEAPGKTMTKPNMLHFSRFRLCHLFWGFNLWDTPPKTQKSVGDMCWATLLGLSGADVGSGVNQTKGFLIGSFWDLWADALVERGQDTRNLTCFFKTWTWALFTFLLNPTSLSLLHQGNKQMK